MGFTGSNPVLTTKNENKNYERRTEHQSTTEPRLFGRCCYR